MPGLIKTPIYKDPAQLRFVEFEPSDMLHEKMRTAIAVNREAPLLVCGQAYGHG